jgi:glutamate--cysteine ligase catalytic subunit
MYKQNVCFSTGVDDTLAKHIAYLFIRDPIVLYQEYLKQDDEKDTDHFYIF